LYVAALWCYGFTNWTFTVLMIWVVGIASGSTIWFTPNFSLLALNVMLLLGPAMACGLAIATIEGTTFAFATFVLTAFLDCQRFARDGPLF
jgi:hypothetical protein